MPANPEPSRREPSLVGDHTGEVGFLDAPGLSEDRVLNGIDEALATLDPGAVLSVHSDAQDIEGAVAVWCEGAGHELLGVITLDDGRVSMVIRKGPPSHGSF